jgi:N-acetylmuramoyl-L-alanine amidase
VRRPLVFGAAALATAVIAPAALAAPVELHVSAGAPAYGAIVRYHGAVPAVVPGEVVRLAIGGKGIAHVAVRADGSFKGAFRAKRSGALTATVSDGSVSAGLALRVRPVIRTQLVATTLFAPAHLVVRTKPASGVKLHLVVVGGKGSKLVDTRHWAHAGQITLPFSADGTNLTAYVSASIGSGAATSSKPVRKTIGVRQLGPGSSGAAVRALKRKLVGLTYHQDDLGSGGWSAETSDAVLAFQKAEGLPRTSVADLTTLARLAHAAAPVARYRTAGRHIEIDKTRQILLIVKNGTVIGTLHISSGATGNTPVGHWKVLWKAPFTHTWLGPAILWRTMTFHGGFAIHGFSPVPAYPASHGCVREPMWAADWTYEQTPVGTPVDVY